MTLREYLRVILLGARNYTDLKYQQKKDIKLQTENKTIVGAINEVNDSIKNVAPGMTEEQAQQLEENTEAIRQLSEDNANKGVSTEQANSLWALIEKMAFTEQVTDEELNAFKTVWGIESSDEPDTPIVPDEPITPTVTLSSISATYNGGNVLVGTELTDLVSNIVVTAKYSDGTSKQVTGYELSGEIVEGSNTITITYQGKSTTFVVVGYVDEEEPSEPSEPTDPNEPVYTLASPMTFDGTMTQYDTGYYLLDKEKSWSVCVDCTDTKRGGTVWNASPNDSKGLALTHKGEYFRQLLVGGSLYKDIGSDVGNYKIIVTHTENTDVVSYHYVINGSTLESGEITYTKYLTDTNIINPYPKTVKLGSEYYGGTIHRFDIYEKVLSTEEIDTFVNTMIDEDTPTETTAPVYKLASATTLDGTSGIDSGYILNDMDKDFSILIDYEPTSSGGYIFDNTKNANLFGPYLNNDGTNNIKIGGANNTVPYVGGTSKAKFIMTHVKGSDTFNTFFINTTLNYISKKQFTCSTYGTNSHTVGNTNTLKIGVKYTNDTNYFKGTIHQFEIHERVVTNEEIEAFMNPTWVEPTEPVNLIDLSTCTLGGTMQDGRKIDENYYITDYIPVTRGNPYICNITSYIDETNKGTHYMYFYTSSKAYKSLALLESNSSMGKTYSVTERIYNATDCGHIRLIFHKNYGDTAFFGEGLV